MPGPLRGTSQGMPGSVAESGDVDQLVTVTKGGKARQRSKQPEVQSSSTWKLTSEWSH